MPTDTMDLTRTERYLVGFHDARAGATSRAFATLPVHGVADGFASTYHALLACLPDSAAPSTVLDLACGDGYLLSLLAGAASVAAPALIGIDLSRGELAAARTRLGERAALYRAKAQQLPLAAASVDAVLSHLALMLMDDADRVVGEVRRVLTRGGVFAGVVGARPPQSPAFDAWIDLYPAAAQRAEFAGIRFGDRRFRSEDGIRSLLGSAFDAITVDELRASRDCTPAQLWDWFLDMYDTDLLAPEALDGFRHRCLQAWQARSGPAGTLRHEDRYLRFRALAA